MRFRPHLTDAQVAAQLERQYHLNVQALEFLPLGQDGWAYRVEDAHAGTFFAKLRQHTGALELAVTGHLHNSLGMPWVLAPLPTVDQAHEAETGGLWLSLYPYISGQDLMQRGLRPGEGEAIGDMLAQLHAAGQRLPPGLLDRLPRESFARHQEMAGRVLAQARETQPPGSVQADLAGFISGSRSLIAHIVQRAQELGQTICQRAPAMVVCHADIHGANILAAADNSLTVIDWDGIMLAPPERDLFFWSDSPQQQEILSAYGLERPLDEEIGAYYGYEWVVQEIADYGENIFFLPLTQEQKADSLAEFKQVFAPGDVAAQALKA